MSNGNRIGLSIIADRYADAMIDLAKKSGQLDIISSDFSRIKKTLEESKDLNTFLSHPTISLEDKKDVIDQIMKNSVSQYTLNLLKLLLDKNRFFILPGIISHYHNRLNTMRNIETAQVITAIPIDNETISRVKSQLEGMFSKKIEVESMVDQEIIAGMIVKIGDKIIDGSIRTKLEDMKRQLI